MYRHSFLFQCSHQTKVIQKGLGKPQTVYFLLVSKGSRKKKKVPPLVAGPLRKKELFLKFFFLFCCHLKIKTILL